MKKPTAYLPLYGNDFFEAIAGYENDVAVGYLRALWHYWSHTGCVGLPENDEYLRRVCGCEREDWARMRGIIFDDQYLFRLEKGVWHQPRCRKEWERCQALFDRRSALGKAGARKRWEKG